ncbi:MAG: DUF4886 domain-containing protein, partial [Spirochaetales bacterium]|nr:DUF4886 domain-containing protein [Spirochaetales bacterium]
EARLAAEEEARRKEAEEKARIEAEEQLRAQHQAEKIRAQQEARQAATEKEKRLAERERRRQEEEALRSSLDRKQENLRLQAESAAAAEEARKVLAQTAKMREEEAAKIKAAIAGLRGEVFKKPEPAPEPPEEEVLQVPTLSYSVDKNEGTVDIDLKANYSFTATVSDDAKDWLYVVSTREVKDHVATIGYRANPTPKQRSGIVTIKSTTLSQTVQIVQAAGDATISVTAEDRTVNPRGMTIVIPVTSNDEIVVTPSDRWMRVKEITAEGYVIEIDINDTGAPREGTITFSSKTDPNVKVTVTFTQKAANVDPRTLKLLAVANSAVEDAMQDLPAILSELGVTNLTLGYFLVDKNLDEQAAAFSAENATLSYHFTDAEGAWKTADTLVAAVLEPDDWDYIILGQTIAEGGQAATFDAGISKIIETVRKTCEYVPFAWHMTWAYQASSTNAGFKAYDNNQADMYDAIVAAVKDKIEGNSEFEKIIPVGTTVQNLRTSFFEDNLTINGVSLSVNIGSLADALTWAKVLTDKNVDNVSYTFNPERYKYESYYVPAILEAVNNAVANPLKVTESLNYPPRKTALKDAATVKN